MGTAIAEARARGWLGRHEDFESADEATRMLIGMRARRLAEGPILGDRPTMAEQGDAIRAERKRKKDERAAANAAARARIMGAWR